jgi:5-formyltetrahydrofolate cyclo-ligase
VTGLVELGQAATVFCFISSPGETDTHGIIRRLLAAGKQVCVPRITDRDGMAAARFSEWQDLLPGAYGIPVPSAATEFTGIIDVCITPGLGFSLRGGRLGHGLGFYDRWFAGHRVGCRLGIAYECQVLDDLPVEEHDAAMDVIVTESRIIRV